MVCVVKCSHRLFDEGLCSCFKREGEGGCFKDGRFSFFMDAPTEGNLMWDWILSVSYRKRASRADRLTDSPSCLELWTKCKGGELERMSTSLDSWVHVCAFVPLSVRVADCLPVNYALNIGGPLRRRVGLVIFVFPTSPLFVGVESFCVSCFFTFFIIISACDYKGGKALVAAFCWELGDRRFFKSYANYLAPS